MKLKEDLNTTEPNTPESDRILDEAARYKCDDVLPTPVRRSTSFQRPSKRQRE